MSIERKTRLRAVSSKRAKEQKKRVAYLRSIEADMAVCERCYHAKATDCHEVLRRSQGGSITDPTNLRLLCRPCHDFLTRSPRQAIAEGWQITRAES